MKLYRFPLGCLSIAPADPLAALEYTLVAAILWDAGWLVRQRYTEEVYFPFVDAGTDFYDELGRQVWPEGLPHPRPSNFEILIQAGRKNLGIDGGSVIQDVTRGKDLEEHLNSACSPAERNNFVSIKMEWFWRALGTARQASPRLDESPPLDWREFRLLCALSSKLGMAKAVSMGWHEFQARAAGWCGKTAMTNSRVTTMLERVPLVLTRAEIRTSLDRLESWRMITRTAYRDGTRGGRMWYSFQKRRAVAHELMLEGEEERTTKRTAMLAENRDADLAAVRLQRAARETKSGHG